MKNDKNNLILDPKKFHNDTLDSLHSNINTIFELLSDAINANNISSKNILMKSCLERFKYINACYDDLAKAIEHMIASPNTSAAQVKSILKECGLQDMDDPLYGAGIYFVEDKKSPANKDESLTISSTTKEDMDIFDIKPDLNESCDKLSTDEEVVCETTDSEKNIKSEKNTSMTTKEKPKKTKKRIKNNIKNES